MARRGHIGGGRQGFQIDPSAFSQGGGGGDDPVMAMAMAMGYGKARRRKIGRWPSGNRQRRTVSIGTAG
jgi:hypothetical protein